MSCSTMFKFYEEELLPTLFERLDQAFPEFNWTRTACGWTAVRRHDNGSTHPSRNLVCQQNWGFIDSQGIATSWLSYLCGGHESSEEQLVAAVRRLARLAGIAELRVPTTISTSEYDGFRRRERRTRLVETFLGYCQAYLDQEHGRLAREKLAIEHHIVHKGPGQLPIGYFTSAHEMAQQLLAAGFTQQEIVDSHVVCDSRLEGRIVLPWRDRWGRVTTVLALDGRPSTSDMANVLYLPGGSTTEAFGLDVALRPSSGGCDHLVLVDSVLDAVYFQSLGVCNVATVGTNDRSISSEHWEKLAAHGVRAVTLAIANGNHGLEQTLVSLKHVDRARQAPQVFTLARRDFAEAASVSDFVRRYGLERFRSVLKNRVHGYRYIALNMLRRHNADAGWNDASLRAALHEAVEFDRAPGRSQRALDLERYFWPTILESTGVRWDHLPKLLGQGTVPDTNRSIPTVPDELGLLLVDLERALRANDRARFRSLILAAAQSFEPTQPDRRSGPPSVVWEEEANVPSPVAPRPEPLSAEPFRPAHHPVPRQSVHFDSTTAAEVKALAHALWDRRGRPDGLDEQIWYEAEQTLRTVPHPFDSATTWSEDALVTV